ncbi:MAG TPA: alpha/beta hydrolase [Solirubrobacteraceae bacterium]|nr:alpha/beta hydrolase [Solirubrobacteraceae bacterium]
MGLTAEVPLERLEFAVDGGTLAAVRLGSPAAPQVLAVHGITGNSRAWVPTARALGDRAALIAVDLRGRAASRGLPAPYGTAAYVADLLAVLRQLEIDATLVVGHSLGAYISSRLAVEHPALVRRLVLVDGGLSIPGAEAVDPQEFATAFLGPALARLAMEFPSREEYHAWWHAHPAFAAPNDVDDGDLHAYADHDLIGSAPALRSSVIAAAIRADAGELATLGSWAHRLTQPTALLCAPRGLLGEPHPMQPLELVTSWAAERAERSGVLVQDVNHYTITLGARGAEATAAAIIDALP